MSAVRYASPPIDSAPALRTSSPRIMTTTELTVATIATLNMPKPSRITPCSETIRLTPCSRLSRLRSGASRDGTNSSPVWKTLAAIDASANRPKMGSIAMPSPEPSSTDWAISVWRSACSGPTSASWLCMMRADVSITFGPSHRRIIAAATSSDAEPRSWLYATCPFSRACSRRCGVASNDFSPDCSAKRGEGG